MYDIDTRIKRRALRNWLVLQSVSHGSDHLESYFEIGGQIVRCEEKDQTLGTWTDNVWRKDVAETHPSGTEGVWIGDSWYSKKAISEGQTMTEKGIDMLKADQISRRQKLGATLMRWSVGGALVPDPLPLVDEILFGTTFVIGAVLYASD